MLTDWEFARSGKKATQFDVGCKALCVEFNFSSSCDKILHVGNTESRPNELLTMIFRAVDKGLLDKGSCLLGCCLFICGARMVITTSMYGLVTTTA